MTCPSGPAGRSSPTISGTLGHGRARSGCGRTAESRRLALAPGIPSIEAQEKRDRTPRGVYRALVENGSLRVAEGLRVPTSAMLHNAALEAFGTPQRILCDRFALGSVKDAVRGVVPVIDRVTRWSDATFDIGALRKMAMDGPLSCVPSARPLLTASLGAATVKNDDQGSCRLVKRDTNNQARDDVAVALVLAVGSLQRQLNRPARRGFRHALAQ